MKIKKVLGFVVLSILLSVSVLSNTVSAALTLNSTSVISSGVITLTGSGASVWDLGSGNGLSLQTVGNGAITTGTGLFTTGGALAVTGNTTLSGALGLSQSGTSALIIGDFSGNTRGTYAIDIQPIRDDGTQIAGGNYSVSLGDRNKATNTYTTSIGNSNTSSGSYATTLGYGNTASNTYNTALGYGNTANALYGLATGYSNTASGNFSSAIGYSNTASASGAVAIGVSVSNSTANSVMIGPSDAAKITILSSGFLGIGNASPQSTLQVGTTNSGTNQYMQIDSENGAPTAGDCNSDSQRGRMIHDYTNFKLYICGGASRGWDHLDLTD